jgi:DNA topoisomerase-1
VPIRDENTLARIKSLAIPPAWQDVQIAANERSNIQVVGVDASDRRQYIYSGAYTKRQAVAKFDRVTSFAKKLPKLRRQVATDLARRRFDKRKVLACAVSLMDETYFRVGTERYAKEHKSYGLTTLRSKHVTIEGDTVLFDFIGKSGQQQHKQVTSRKIARTIKKLDEMPGHELFRYYDEENKLKNLTSSDVNEYIKDIMGDDYTAKDFRTWGGTLHACMELAKIDRPPSVRERKKIVTACVRRVARKLGNTPAIARSSYIDPRILSMFEKSDSLGKMYQTIARIGDAHEMHADEKCTLKLLSKAVA